MPFQIGNKLGGNPRNKSHKYKEKVLEKWFDQFQKEGTTKKIHELWDTDFPEYMRIFIALMPKETKIEADINWTEDDKKEALNRIQQIMVESIHNGENIADILH